ncbi:anti-anti-sigma factor [Aneurinibacillus soli]|uniref:Anti-sigma factor antagonist n=1 Tax=Aneurinibacillus soli TaxID=1500254 RepID=A0A0U5B8H1_9BACL|nr:STAS domain-containing protein [Aneurinibacillus soli]PYE62490.1 anti-anti-sigma factor [Aneurinibacillus soli]BAU27053.1 STAS domain protein [Aneurinibacillus soli]
MLVTDIRGFRVLTLEGEIDYSRSRAAAKTLFAAITADHTRYILDTTQLTGVDSTGLALLFSFCKKCHSQGFESRVVTGQTSWSRLLHFSKLDRVLHLYDTLDAALDDDIPVLSPSLSILDY